MDHYFRCVQKLITLIFTSLFIGLNAQPLIDSARSVMFANPEKADALLDQFEKQIDCVECTEYGMLQKTRGVVHYLNRSYGKADSLYQIAIQVFEATNNQKELCNTLSNTALIKSIEGGDSLAVDIYKRVLLIASKEGFCDVELRTCVNLGNLFLSKGILSNANEYANRILDAPCSGDFPVLTSSAFTILGSTANRKELYEEALGWHKKAASLRRSSGNERALGESLFNIGNAYSKVGREDSALIYWEQAEPFFTQYGNQRGLAYLTHQIGIYHYQNDDFDRALSYYERGIDLAQDLRLTELEVDVLHNIALAHEKNGNNQKALNVYKQFQELKDSIRNTQIDATILELEEKYQSREKELAVQRSEREKAEAELEKANITLELDAQRSFTIILVLTVVILIILIGLLFLYGRSRRRRLQAEAERDRLSVEFRLLQAQMNPHFIFNVLNSIQAQVSKGNTFEAEMQLARFGKLIRSILQQSRKEWIPLSDELEQLERYISIEAQRFPDKFTYQIETDPAISKDEIEVPPMLIQPFVENAILHGLSRLTDRKGQLILRFKDRADYLECIIEDNGIGRKAAARFKKTKDHESLSMTLIRERLVIAGVDQPVQVQDAENATGTVVVLRIPKQDRF